MENDECVSQAWTFIFLRLTFCFVSLFKTVDWSIYLWYISSMVSNAVIPFATYLCLRIAWTFVALGYKNLEFSIVLWLIKADILPHHIVDVETIQENKYQKKSEEK
jgi:hypothetical protein